MDPAPTLPAGFNAFLGNTPAVESLRAAIAAGHLPHSLILSGPAGAGKYTLALMLAMAVECERQPRELSSNGQPLAGFCGVCSNCTRIASAANLEEQVEAAVLAREELRETDKKETRVLIQPHPDVLILPPDPPQLLIKLGQVRTLIQRAHYLPSEAPRKIFILTSASMMKEAANSLLKVLEEPPDTVLILILAENPGELLPPSAPAAPPSASARFPWKRSKPCSPPAVPKFPPSSARSSPASRREQPAAPSPSTWKPTPPPAPTPSSSSETPPPCIQSPTPTTPPSSK